MLTCTPQGPCSMRWSKGRGGEGAGKKGQGRQQLSLQHLCSSSELQGACEKAGPLKGHHVKVEGWNIFHATNLLAWFIKFYSLYICTWAPFVPLLWDAQIWKPGLPGGHLAQGCAAHRLGGHRWIMHPRAAATDPMGEEVEVAAKGLLEYTTKISITVVLGRLCWNMIVKFFPIYVHCSQIYQGLALS